MLSLPDEFAGPLCLETAVTSTDVEPNDATQEPSAKRASLPKESLSGGLK